MFEFRLINTPDGNQIIDRSVSTSYDSLNPVAMLEYIQVDNSLYFENRQNKKRRR